MTSSFSRVSLVVGTGAIGRAVAILLAREGDAVAMIDANASALDDAAHATCAHSDQILTFQTDITDRAALLRACEDTRSTFGPISSLFVAVGAGPRARLVDSELIDWRGVIDTHLTGTFNVCQLVLPMMVEMRSGSIVTMASDFAVVGLPSYSSYCAAKTAIYTLTKCLALEVASFGIRVNAVGPGPIDTAHLRRGHTRVSWWAAVRAYRRRVPMARLGRPDEVATVVRFLLSDRARHITGQLIQPNGGQVMW